MKGFTQEEEVELFKEYLRIKTVQPVANEEYKRAAEFLVGLGSKMGLKPQVHELHEGKKVVILTLEGSQAHLPAILLNSHIDVVPVEEEKWECDPFEAKERENGDIVARGSQGKKN